MATQARKGYSRLQIGLHWIIALLIGVQFLYHDPMEEAWDAVRDGLAVPAELSFGVTVHTVVGVSVLVLALLRLTARFTRGAPALPADEPAPLRLAAGATHVVLYVLMIAVPLGGLAAWAGGVAPAAGIHGLAANVLFLLVALHILGALYQRFVLKSDVLTRMVVPEK